MRSIETDDFVAAITLAVRLMLPGGGVDGVPAGVLAGDKVAEAAKMAAIEMLENVFANFMIVVVRG